MSAPTAPDAPHGAPPAPQALLSHRQILAIFSGLMIGMFLAALDQTIVATSIRTIADDLDGLSLQAWATTAYLITGTISTPLYGKLSDLYGRKPLFLAAIGIFVVGSLACSFAASMYQLAAFRALQGLGAGGLFSLALTIIGDIVAPRERARYQGYFVAVFGTSSVLGPLAGGFFAGQPELLGITGWRWVFLLNVPLGIVALAVVTRVLNIPHTRRPRRIDWPGALALTLGVVPLLVLAEQGRLWGWGSGRSLLCAAVGAVGLVLFVLAERRIGDDALLPLRFFRNGVFAWGSLAGFVAGMGMFGALALLPLYLQIVKGSSPTQAGLQTLPLVVGIMSMSIFSGQFISRTGRYKIWPIIGLSFMIVGIGLLSRVGVDTPYWRVALVMLLVGWGLGAHMQPLTLAVQNAMPPRDMGVATASATFFRQMGGTTGTAVFLSILFAALPGRIVDGFRAAATDPAFTAAVRDPAVLANPANQPILSAVAGGAAPNLDDSSFLRAVDPALARPILEGFASSMSVVFLSASAVLVVGLLAVLRMKEVPLRTQSGVEAVRAEEDGAGSGSVGVPSEASLAGTRAAAASTVPAPVAGSGLTAADPVSGDIAGDDTSGGTVSGETASGDRAPAGAPRPWRRSRPAGSGPVGGDGARAVVVGGTGSSAGSIGGSSGSAADGGSVADPVPGTGGPGTNGTGPNGAGTNGVGSNGTGTDGTAANGAGSNGAGAWNGAAGQYGVRVDGRLLVDGVRTDGSGSPAAVLPAAPPELDTPTGGAVTGDDAHADDRDPRPGTDARDRLLAALLPDPARAVALLTDAERARDAARRARRALADHGDELDRARTGLEAQGLRPAQVRGLLGLTPQESGAEEADGSAPLPVDPRGGRHRGATTA